MKNIAYIRLNNRKYITKKEKFYIKLQQIFHKITVEVINEGIIINITKKNNYKDIIKILEKYQIKSILFDMELQNIEKELDSYISKNKIEKYTGKILMKYNILEILKYISKQKNIELLMYNIYIFVNEYNIENIKIIEQLAQNCKCVNIITNQISKFKKLENEMYNKNMLITVSNNRRKSAKNAEIIINIDFDKKQFEKYNINMNSIIINTTNEIKFFENMFNGVIINNIVLKTSYNYSEYIKEFYGNININKFLEKDILNCRKENNFMKKTKIIDLIGIRGVIQKFV